MASGDGKRRSRAAGRSASATKKTQGIDPQSVREKVTKLVGGRACHMVKAATATGGGRAGCGRDVDDAGFVRAAGIAGRADGGIGGNQVQHGGIRELGE
jgi:hypothetical protein